jgi:hypothetical protein
MILVKGAAGAAAEIRTGKMDPKLANVVGYVGTSYLRALEVSDVETRLEKLERYLEESRRESSKAGVGGNG